jgi:hypothetical protein
LPQGTKPLRNRILPKPRKPPTNRGASAYFTTDDLLLGDPSKAKQKLGWSHETSVRELAREMVHADLKIMQATAMTGET